MKHVLYTDLTIRLLMRLQRISDCFLITLFCPGELVALFKMVE